MELEATRENAKVARDEVAILSDRMGSMTPRPTLQYLDLKEVLTEEGEFVARFFHTACGAAAGIHWHSDP
jgi:hypothetical protein